MRKGQKVRILANNEIGTIAERKFVCIHGKRMVSYLVYTKDGRQCWYQPESLADTHEKVNIIFENESTGQKFGLKIDYDYAGSSKVELEDLSGIGLFQHKGPHAWLANCLMKVLTNGRTEK